MKKIIIFCCILLSFSAMADFQFSPGVFSGLRFESSEKNSFNSPYFKAYSPIGFEINSQVNLPWIFSFNLGVMYGAGSGRSQYQFYDTKTNTTYIVSDLDTSYDFLNMTGTLRLHFINGENVKMFVGYGYLTSTLSLSYSSNDYEAKHGNRTGLYSAHTSTSVPVLESGIEYFWNKTDGLQLLGRFYKMKTGNIPTLNNSTLTGSMTQISFLYNHVVNWDFFWK